KVMDSSSNDNNLYGLYLTGEGDGVDDGADISITGSEFCDNGNYDINNTGAGALFGSGNTCDTYNNWADEEKNEGCTYPCSLITLSPLPPPEGTISKIVNKIPLINSYREQKHYENQLEKLEKEGLGKELDLITKQYANNPDEMKEQFNNLAQDYKTKYGRQIQDASQRKQLYKAVGNLIDSQVDEVAKKRFSSRQRESITSARKDFKKSYKKELEAEEKQLDKGSLTIQQKTGLGETGQAEELAVRPSTSLLTTKAVWEFIIGS
ncbi:OmpH family outer membrane protein, partial [archaeon]|nr:OmpH family outer membrane protein [archaeon]